MDSFETSYASSFIEGDANTSERGTIGEMRYQERVRSAARRVLADQALRPPAELIYVPKASLELEPLLALFPDVLALPTTAKLSPREIIELRAFPLHPLGLVEDATWGDGRLLSPADYFFHDLDHARFKIREDLRALGVEIPDAYQDGTTIDPRTGQHRTILPAAAGRIGRVLWERARERLELGRRLLARAASLEGPGRAGAAELLLFEIVHEKSFPLEADVLLRELGREAHPEKIQKKRAAGFYGAAPPAPEVMDALDEARVRLREVL
jgi:hypothetical protein